MDRQTNRQTDRIKKITSFFGGGNKRLIATAHLQRMSRDADRYIACRMLEKHG